jgi:solute carrier family 1 (neuronal/epithelial high affinity glutamate transporter), member 1
VTGKRSSNCLLILIITGITIGILLGGFIPEAGRQIKFLGDMFMRVLLMLVVPLVMVSMIVGVIGLGDIRKLGKLGGRTSEDG